MRITANNMEQKTLTKTDVINQFETLTDALNIAYTDARLSGETDMCFCGFLDFFQMYAGSSLKREYAEYAKKHHESDTKVELKGIYFLPDGQIGTQISDREFFQKIKKEENDGIMLMEETIYLYLTKTLEHIENFSDTRQFYNYLDIYTSLRITICHGVIISYIKQMERILSVKGIEPERILSKKNLEMEIPYDLEDYFNLAVGF